MPMPATASASCRMCVASIRPRWRSGMRSAIATYRKPAAATESTYWLICGSHSSANTASTAPSTADSARHDIEEQRFPPRVAGVQQNREVAELLRNLVRRHGERGAHAERDRRPHRRADDDTVEKVVERVADDHHRRGHAVRLAVVRVAVPPQHELLEQEEQHDAAEQRAEHGPRGEMARALPAAGRAARRRAACRRRS